MAENETTKETTPVGRPNIYVQSLTFNDGKTLQVDKNDIVVFVGPNNVGKSQTLKDIQKKAEGDAQTVLLQDASFQMDSSFPIRDWLSSKFITHTEHNETQTYRGLDFAIASFVLASFSSLPRPGYLSHALIRLLRTKDRLSIADSQPNIDLNETPKHPIHLLQKNDDLRQKISDCFERAFSIPVFPFTLNGKTTPMIMGAYPILSGSYPNELARVAATCKLLSTYPHLDQQGDGMRSFVGLMLYLIIDHYNTFLIDEPESFLHPPQARLMGEIVGDLLSDEQQAFISTHSIHFIQGLLEKCPKRVKVVRITRTGNTNTFSILDQTRILELSKDPFLKYSNLLEGLFYKNVVLCEADADCMFYSMINSASDMKGPKGADTLFVHCGGKQRMASVARDLRALHVDFRVVPDFDIFNDKNTLKNLVEACGGTWSECERDFNVLSADILNRSRNDKPENVLLTEIQNLLNANSSKPVSNSKIESIKSLLEGESEWGRLKKSGLHGIPSGDPQNACTALLDKLKAVGIHVVPCGELERFVPDCGGHGPSWIQSVLDKHPELSDSVFAGAKDFVKSWNL